MLTFPDGFLWGAATAAHQVEGNNTSSNWWAMEHAPASPMVEPSGDAADHFHRYPGYGMYQVGRMAQTTGVALPAELRDHRLSQIIPQFPHARWLQW